MKKFSIALAIGGLALMPLSTMSQDIASAPATTPSAKFDHMLFMEKGTGRVPDSAMETVRSAADAAKLAPVRIEGRADHVNAVKQELVRQGAPASSISVRTTAAQPLAKAGDGVTDPTDRGVALRF